MNVLSKRYSFEWTVEDFTVISCTICTS